MLANCVKRTPALIVEVELHLFECATKRHMVEELDEDCPRCIEEGRTPPGRLQKRLGR